MIVQKYYEPTGTYEIYDTERDVWYNGYGQQIRDPDDYCDSQEGYTPFGDE